MKPKALNFQVNDVCNARCVMCGVWKHARSSEMSPSAFGALLRDPFFSEVEHVGITGGEPTLRRDLADFYLALLDACPRLTGASFITHGFDTDRALSIYGRVAEAYRTRGLHFHGMVSIDGVGSVHDRIRGRAGAFTRAASTLFGLKSIGIPTSACCTIVRSNVWHVQDLLEWGFDKTYIRFRVGEFINRLSNAGATGEIRAFDAAERSALISFFTALILHYEPEELVRRTYGSIVGMLAGDRRRTGCAYQDGRAINVDCQGRFAVCAPKGMPHALGPDPAASVDAAAQERETIVATECAGCIHDYHDDWRPDVARREAVAAEVRRLLDTSAPGVIPASPSTRTGRDDLLERISGTDGGPANDPGDTCGVHDSFSGGTPQVVVLGWYGTETIGDMAILCGIVQEYRARAPEVQFIVPSQFPDYTRHNCVRLGLDCRVESYGDPALAGDLWGAGTVIVGGGPLMDIPQMRSLAAIFERARARGRHTVIEGCGIGPAHNPETAEWIRRIAGAAVEIRLRDRESARLLAALGSDREVTVTGDPAARWVQSTGIRHAGESTGPITVFARELTHEYPQRTTAAEATGAMVSFIRRLCDTYPDRTVDLHAMHHFPVGGDDREYARRLARLVGDARCRVDEVPRTPLETLQIMAASSLVVCMRFHSLVFADGIGAPLLAIDYTDGGKVASYVAEHGLAARAVSLPGLGTMRPERLFEPAPVVAR